MKSVEQQEQISEQVAGLISNARTIVVLTGAGISTQAGYADFRGVRGIFATGEYPSNVFDIETFKKNPKIFYTYARDFVKMEKQRKPTFTHRFLAALERSGKLQWVLTQNIDGLHQKAGNRNVLELHGSYQLSHCTSCGVALGYDDFSRKVEADWVPRCNVCNGIIKPDIVFYGEDVKGFENAERIVRSSDLLIIIGTSLSTHPVDLLPELAAGRIVLVNKGKTGSVKQGTIIVQDDIDVFFKSVQLALRF